MRSVGRRIVLFAENLFNRDTGRRDFILVFLLLGSITTHNTTPIPESPENKLITNRFFAFVGSNPDNRGGGSCLSLSVEREIIHRIAGCLIS